MRKISIEGAVPDGRMCVNSKCMRSPFYIPPRRNGDSRCFIATATLGSPDHPYVLELRNYRDEVLLHSASGRLFVGVYYKVSLPISRVIKNSWRLKYLVRVFFIKPALILARKHKKT